MLACLHCGEANPPHARFCSACGAQLIAQTSEFDLSSRKVVTILFSDLAGSTGLGERHDPEALRHLIGRYFESMRRVLERHGGTVEKFIGDAIMAVFGHPVAHEDDALRAVRAAAEMRVALGVLNERLAEDGAAPLEARIGINTGEVVAGEPRVGHGFVTGDVVNTAKRLEEAAASGEILVGEGTLHLVRNAVHGEVVDGLALRGKRLPTSAFRVVEVSTEAPGVARRLDVPIVNRKSELNALQALFDKVVTRARCSLVLVLGAAGIGKSRLAKEFVASLGGEVSVLHGRCVSYSEGVTFSPVVDVVKEAMALTDADRPEQAREKLFRLISDQDERERVYERLSGVLGLGGAELPAQEIFWAVRRLLEALAARRPVIVVFDDVHWGEPTFLDLLEYLAGRSQGFPILLCCLARPELLEARPSLSATDGGAEHIRLEALREEETRELVAQFLDTGEVAEEVHRYVAAAAEGNPLFLEELLQMLIDERHLRREGGEWRTSARLLGVRLPPTIQALLAARLDRLAGGERAVIERAAVIGPVFHWSAVAELAPASLVERLAAHLQALVRRDLVRPVESEFAGEDAFAFSHGLMRDAAYVSIPKEVRAELHYRYAAWLERKIAGVAGEYEELVAYHLEQSVRYRHELGRIDERTGQVAARAGMLLSLAGKRALARGDAPAAGNLLERAAWLLTDRPERAQVLLDFTVALRDLGELVRAEALVEEAAEAAHVEGNAQLEARAHLERAILRIYTRSGGAGDDLLRLVDRTIPVLEQAGDDEGLAKAWYLVGAVHWARCHAREMEQVLDRALAHARRAGSQRELAFVLNALARAVVAGPTPVDVALTRCTDILEEAAGDRTQQAIVLTWVAMLEAMRGNVEYARSLCADSQAILEELGQKLRAIALQGYVGAIELLAGNPLRAEHLFRSTLDALEPLGEQPNMRAISARLAEALTRLGRDEEAERFARACRETAPLDDLVTQVHGRTALATILARRGEYEEAEALCREALSLADETDWLNMRGDAYTCLAGVLASAGKVDAAHAAAQAAARLYELKGNLVSARRAQTAAGSRSRQPDLI